MPISYLGRPADLQGEAQFKRPSSRGAWRLCFVHFPFRQWSWGGGQIVGLAQTCPSLPGKVETRVNLVPGTKLDKIRGKGAKVTGIRKALCEDTYVHVNAIYTT